MDRRTIRYTRERPLHRGEHGLYFRVPLRSLPCRPRPRGRIRKARERATRKVIGAPVWLGGIIAFDDEAKAIRCSANPFSLGCIPEQDTARRGINYLKHSPRQAHFDDATSRVGEPVGERVFGLS